MTKLRTARIEEIEARWDVLLPSDYRQFLATHREPDEDRQQVVTSNPEYWGVRHLFELGGGPHYLQMDQVLGRVGDVLPPKSLPSADEGGNLYLLQCGQGGAHGCVVWWDHERDLGDHQTDAVAPSFTSFLALLGAED
jgi:hypothetical protein